MAIRKLENYEFLLGHDKLNYADNDNGEGCASNGDTYSDGALGATSTSDPAQGKILDVVFEHPAIITSADGPVGVSPSEGTPSGKPLQETKPKRQLARTARGLQSTARDWINPELNARLARFRYVEGAQQAVYGLFGPDRTISRVDRIDEEVDRQIDAIVRPHNGGKSLPRNMISELREAFKRQSRCLVDLPRPFEFKSDPGIVFYRAPFDPTPGDHRAFTGPGNFIGRCEFPELAMALTWTLFEPRYRGRANSVFYDPTGLAGKSTFLGTIRRVLGTAIESIGEEDLQSTGAHRYVRYLNKIGLICPDLKDPSLLCSASMRRLTSCEDSVPIDLKFGAQFSVNLNLRAVIATNFQPEFSAVGKSDSSRWIVIPVAPRFMGEDSYYCDALDEQMPAFLYACREAYGRLCPDHANFILPEEAIARRESSTLAAEGDFLEVFAEKFTANLNGTIFGVDFERAIASAGFSKHRRREFIAWLTYKHGVRNLKSNGRSVFRGICLKSSGESSSVRGPDGLPNLFGK